MTIREEIENTESNILSQFASLSKNSKGRSKKEKECDIRTAYQRDRDRIIHSKSFRRLKHKTQVFISPEGDHYRTRLTHTLEVSQIARTVARALKLNEDLTEAIALAHDLGHTPFGHSGENALNSLAPCGFKHYEQSLRVVDKLEKMRKGLNLTYEVRNGIVCHTKGKPADTMEGRLVKIADRIAYINHDIDDAIRANILSENDIPKEISKTIGNNFRDRINCLVHSLIRNTYNENLKMSNEIEEAFLALHEFMYQKIYLGRYTEDERIKVPHFIKCLYEYFSKFPKKMPRDMQKTIKSDGLDKTVCDYIAGMTDDFANKTFKNIFIPKGHK